MAIGRVACGKNSAYSGLSVTVYLDLSARVGFEQIEEKVGLRKESNLDENALHF